jgi:hypothetical protein
MARDQLARVAHPAWDSRCVEPGQSVPGAPLLAVFDPAGQALANGNCLLSAG